MKTNEPLSGSTAGFIAAIANALSRNITHERMTELVTTDPDKLRLLLLPLINDNCQLFVSAVDGSRRMHRFSNEGLRDAICMQTYALGSPYTMRAVMKEARARTLAPLEAGEAQYLCELMAETTDVHQMFGGIFPFVREKKLRMFVFSRYAKPVQDIQVDLNKDDGRVKAGWPCFFKKGYDDGSNCFKC